MISYVQHNSTNNAEVLLTSLNNLFFNQNVKRLKARLRLTKLGHMSNIFGDRYLRKMSDGNSIMELPKTEIIQYRTRNTLSLPRQPCQACSSKHQTQTADQVGGVALSGIIELVIMIIMSQVDLFAKRRAALDAHSPQWPAIVIDNIQTLSRRGYGQSFLPPLLFFPCWATQISKSHAPLDSRFFYLLISTYAMSNSRCVEEKTRYMSWYIKNFNLSRSPTRIFQGHIEIKVSLAGFPTHVSKFPGCAPLLGRLQTISRRVITLHSSCFKVAFSLCTKRSFRCVILSLMNS